MDITFRTIGPWGAGKGANLLPSEVDSNFWAIAQAINDIINDPVQPNGIAGISVSGTQMTFTLTNGDTAGPFTLPVLTFRWRDEWEPSTSYAVLDVFTVADTGIFCVVIAHTSGTTFDPNLTIGGQPALKQLFGSADSSLEGLSDVTITTVADGDVIRWVAADGKWENQALGTMATQDAGAVAITGGSITGMPTPLNPSDVATKAYADALPAGGTAPNATMIANISGAAAAPSPHTLSDYLDYVFGTTTRGCIMIRSGSGWVAMQPGGNGYYLQTKGSGLDPVWAAGTAGVVGLYAGTGIDVGALPITSTGTIALAALPDGDILANISGASASPVPTTLAQWLDHVLGTARGQIITRTVAGWASLAPGSTGQYLKTQGSGADLMWDSPAGAGTVTSVAAGTGISTGGSPITSTGTVALAPIADATMLANVSGASAVPLPTSFTALLDHDLSSTQGAFLYRSATGWIALAPGTSGQVLTTAGAAANPSWQNAPSGGPIANLQIVSNISGSTTVPTGNTLSSIFDAIISSARGTLFYRTNSGWTGLAPGTAGQVLTTGGVSSDPHWTAGSAAALAGLSDVTLTAPADQDQLTYIASAGKWENKTLSSVLDTIAGNTRGAILERGATGWASIAPGRSSYYAVAANGAGADPSYRPFGGYKWHQVTTLATTTNIPGTMSLGSSGGTIGGTTFTTTANGPVTIDGSIMDGVGTNFGVGTRVLFKNQTAQPQNMIWVLTTIGTSTTPSIFTLATDFDDQTYFGGGDVVAVGAGAVNADTIWISQVGAGFTLGSSAINWILAAGSSVGTPKYVVSCFVPGTMTASQRLLYHRVSKAVNFPANFGLVMQGHTSEAGGSTNATASTVISVDKAPTATPNTFTTIGTITIAAGSVTPTFATTGGAAVAFAQGDVLRLVGPASADTTFADFYATLAGSE